MQINISNNHQESLIEFIKDFKNLWQGENRGLYCIWRFEVTKFSIEHFFLNYIAFEILKPLQIFGTPCIQYKFFISKHQKISKNAHHTKKCLQ